MGRTQIDPRVCWPVTLAKLMSSSFSEKPCQKLWEDLEEGKGGEI